MQVYTLKEAAGHAKMGVETLKIACELSCLTCEDQRANSQCQQLSEALWSQESQVRRDNKDFVEKRAFPDQHFCGGSLQN